VSSNGRHGEQLQQLEAPIEFEHEGEKKASNNMQEIGRKRIKSIERIHCLCMFASSNNRFLSALWLTQFRENTCDTM